MLSELQIVTAGEFDPWPYLVMQADPVDGGTVAVPASVYNQVSTEEMEQLHELLTDVANTTGASLKVPAINDGFIENLMLPEGESAQGETDGSTELSGESTTDESGSDAGFYEPYQPAKEKDNGDG